MFYFSQKLVFSRNSCRASLWEKMSMIMTKWPSNCFASLSMIMKDFPQMIFKPKLLTTSDKAARITDLHKMEYILVQAKADS